MAESGNEQLFLPGVELPAEEGEHTLDSLGVTELMVNAFRGNVSRVQKLLLEDSSRIFVQNSHGATALDYAVSNKQLKVVDVFLAHDADLNALDADGYNILHRAVISGQLDKVKFCVEVGVNIDYHSRDNATAVILAVKHGHEDIVKYLINIICDLNVRDQEGYSALEHAFVNNFTSIQQVLESASQGNDSVDADSAQQLIIASSNGNIDAIEALIAQHGNAIVHFMDPSDNYTTAFQVACKTGQLNAAQCLKQHGANIHARVTDGETALMMASLSGHAHIVEWLIRNGALVNYINSEKGTALCCAIVEEHVRTIEMLVERGALLNIGFQSPECAGFINAIHIATMTGSEWIVQYLLEHGAYGDRACAEVGTALGMAAGFGSVECIRQFIKHDCNVNKRQREGYTPLMFASAAGQLEAVKYLVQHGADIDSANDHGETALQLALSSDHAEIVTFLTNQSQNQSNTYTVENDDSPLSMVSPSVQEQLLTICTGECESYEKFIILIDQGVNVNMQSEGGKTPLIVAVIHENVKCVLWLLKNNADINLQDTSGMTPIMHAVQQGHLNVAKILLHSKADLFMKDATGRDALSMAESFDQKQFVDLMKTYIKRKQRDNLIAAVYDLDFEKCSELLQHGVDVNSVDSIGNTAMSLCIANRSSAAAEIARLLCTNGANIELPDSSGRTPIQQCIVCGNNNVAKILLKHGAQIANCLPSILVDACIFSDIDIIQTMIEHMKAITANHVSHFVEVALKSAAMNDQADVVNHLLTKVLPLRKSCSLRNFKIKIMLIAVQFVPESYNEMYEAIKSNDYQQIASIIRNLPSLARNDVRMVILQNKDDVQNDEVEGALWIALHSGNFEMASAISKWDCVIIDNVPKPLQMMGLQG